jgi:hypothetical protein
VGKGLPTAFVRGFGHKKLLWRNADSEGNGKNENGMEVEKVDELNDGLRLLLHRRRQWQAPLVFSASVLMPAAVLSPPLSITWTKVVH